MIDGLPSYSAYQEAVALDEELAERYVDDEAPGEYRPRISDWSPTEQLLAGVFDRLGEVVYAISATNGGKPSEPKAWPRPETAQDRVVRRRQRQQYDDLLDLVEQAKRRASE